LIYFILLQAYYNPSIIKVLNKLISGVDNIEPTELAAEATAKVAAQEAAGQETEKDKKTASGKGGAGAGAGAGASASNKSSSSSDSSGDDGDDEDFDVNAARPVKRKVGAVASAHRPSVIGMNKAKVASTNKIKDILGSCLYQISIPDNFNEKTYGKLFKHLSGLGMIPMGLLRGTFAGMSVGPKANRAPYVYTNPDKDVEVFKCDRVFVLSTKPVQADSKLDLKVLSFFFVIFVLEFVLEYFCERESQFFFFLFFLFFFFLFFLVLVGLVAEHAASKGAAGGQRCKESSCGYQQHR
jgi:hypothetical protein